MFVSWLSFIESFAFQEREREVRREEKRREEREVVCVFIYLFICLFEYFIYVFIYLQFDLISSFAFKGHFLPSGHDHCDGV